MHAFVAPSRVRAALYAPVASPAQFCDSVWVNTPLAQLAHAIAAAPLDGAAPATDATNAAGRGVFLLFAVAMLGLSIVAALLFWAALRHRRRARFGTQTHRAPPAIDEPVDPWAEAGKRLDPPNPDNDATDIVDSPDPPKS